MYHRLLTTIDELTAATGISRSELYRAMASDPPRLRWRRVAGRRRFKIEDVEAYLNGGG
jgi:predicted DNA-binding transcriptional regulator AlpA